MGFFAFELGRRGHEVDVICEVPNHPQGVVHPRFRGRLLVRRHRGSLQLRYVWVYTRRRKTAASRVAFYGSYAGMAAAVGCLRRRPDVILATSPPLPVAVAAAVVSRRHRVPWVLDVRDLWPEAAVALGELSDPRLIGLADRLKRALYRDATAITTVTEPFCESIAGHVGLPDKVILVPNGTTKEWIASASHDVDRSDLGLPRDTFLWTYAGNVGLAQGLDVGIKAAARLGDRFHLLVLGDGAARPALEAHAHALCPRQVTFKHQVSQSIAMKHLRASDALLVSLRNDPTLETFVPSKLYDFCATGRPTVLAVAGHAAAMAERSRAALCVRPGDVNALVSAISRLESDDGLRSRLGEAGKRFARANLRDRHIDRLLGVLEHVAFQPGV